MKTQPVIYHCDDCGKPIRADSDDPVHKPGSSTYCTRCVRKPQTASARRSSDRGTAARARWAKMTPEERAERVRKMQAGRGPRVVIREEEP